MTRIQIVALILLIAGSLLFFKTYFFDSDSTWDQYHRSGMLAYGNKDFTTAEEHFKKALKKAESFSEGDSRRILTLNNLSELYRMQERYPEEETYLLKSLAIAERLYGPDNPNVAAYLINLAENYRQQKSPEKAATVLKRALDIWEKTLGGGDPMVEFLEKRYQNLLKEIDQDTRANATPK